MRIRIATVLLLASFSPSCCFLSSPAHQLGGVRPTALFSTTKEDDVKAMRVGEIKKELESYGISTKSFVEKSELVDALVKARSQGMKAKPQSQPKEPTSSASSSGGSSSRGTPSSEDKSSSASRDERLKKEMEAVKSLKVSELKRELEERGVSTRSFMEKSEFVKALAEARVDNIQKEQQNEEGYAEYKNVEVLTDDASGPRRKRSQQEQSSPFGGASSNPFGGGGSSGSASPFGGAQGGGMGGIADMLKNMGMGTGGSPFGGGTSNPFGGSSNPFSGAAGMGDEMGKAQELMKNPKVRALMAKAQRNPKIMSAMTECMSNPAAFAKYQNDPEVAEIINELKQYM